MRKLRIALAASGKPKVGLICAATGTAELVGVTTVFQRVKVTWLSKLVASTLASRFNLSFTRNVREIEPFNVNCPGPKIESRPALPHCPAAGAV